MAHQHLESVIFDWSGTLVDFGARAPTLAMVRLFEHRGIEIEPHEVRGPLGLSMRAHLQALGRQRRIAAAWKAVHGREMNDDDVDALCAQWRDARMEAARECCHAVPGASEVVRRLRARGLRLGSTSACDRATMRSLMPLAREQGLALDQLVCVDEVREARPSPLGMYRCFAELGVWPAWRVVKVDDSLTGLLEGQHAGCWTVGVLASGERMGLSLQEWASLDTCERDSRLQAARDALEPAHPDFLVETVADLLPVVDEIESMLAIGLRPGAARDLQRSVVNEPRFEPQALAFSER